MRDGERKDYRSANLQSLPPGDAPLSLAPVWQSDAAKILNVYTRSVADARKVHDTAPPEITRALDDDRISVSLAEKVADLPDEPKADIIAAHSGR